MYPPGSRIPSCRQFLRLLLLCASLRVCSDIFDSCTIIIRPTEAWKHVRKLNRLTDPQELAILREVAAWREMTARIEDRHPTLVGERFFRFFYFIVFAFCCLLFVILFRVGNCFISHDLTCDD